MKKLYLLLAMMLVLPISAQAGEEELYAPVPPADSSFVRVIGPITLDGNGFPASGKEGVSDFTVIKNGSYNLNAGAVSKDIDVEAGKYYTLALAGGEAKVFNDALIENPSKAVIYFYNLSDAEKAGLKAPEHKATVFEDIAAGEGKSREINAVTFDLAVTADGKDVATLKGIELKRQIGTSVILTGTKGDYKAYAVTNKVAQ